MNKEILDFRKGSNSMGIPIVCELFSDHYSVKINDETIVYTINEEENIDLDMVYYNALQYANATYGVREKTKEELELERQSIQDEIQAEILLNQADILANQNAQDEVLAEVLLNSLEVSTNV